MTTSHLVTVPGLARLRPLSHPPQVGGGYGQTEVDVGGVLQFLEVLRSDRKDLDFGLCLLSLPANIRLIFGSPDINKIRY